MTGLYLRLRKVATRYLKMGAVTVNELSTDGTMAGNSDQALPTEKAVKTYVDAKVLEGNELKDDPAPELSANLDVSGFAIVDSVGGVVQTDGLLVNGVLNIGVVEGDVELDGASGTIEYTGIPIGAWLLGYTMINTVAVNTNDDNTYTGEIAATGPAIKLNGDVDIVGTLNTKVTSMTGMGIVNEPVVVTLTPGGSGTAFSAGKVKMGIVYMVAGEYADVE